MTVLYNMIQTATERAARKQLECTQAMSVVTNLAGSGSILEKILYRNTTKL